MKAEIVSIGTELLMGEITDTDAAYLAGQLPLLGIELNWVSQVGDDLAMLVEVLQRAWQRSDLVLTTGGLGPTDDDLTRQAIADMLGEKITTDPSLEKVLRDRFVLWGMEMPPTNLRQAALIPSAWALSNPVGTAPGWWVEKNGHILVAMPGPPRELQEMWQKQVVPKLQQRSPTVIRCRTIKTFGLPEAAMGEKVFPLFASGNPSLGVYAKMDGIHLRMMAKSDTQEQAEEMIAKGEASIKAVVGDYIWGYDSDVPEAVIGRLLVEKGLTLAVMEDYTGGWLTAGFGDIPGSSAFFKGSLVAGSREAKVASGVDDGIISRYGPVSSEVAQAMAEAARRFFKADIGLSNTGIEETEAAPTGVVYMGITNGESKKVISRTQGKRRIINSALFELRRVLTSPVKRE